MAIEPVPGMRTKVSDGPEGLSFIVPAPRQIFAMLFLPLWLTGWVFGEAFALRTLVTEKGPAQAFLVIWLTGWTIGGAFAIFAWFWMLSGRERILLKPGALAHRYELFNLSVGREYDLAQVRNLRVSPQPLLTGNGRYMFRTLGLSGGVVAFDYGAHTIRMMSSVTREVR